MDPLPKRQPLRCDPVMLDPVAAWRGLPERAQEEIGATAIALIVAMMGLEEIVETGDPKETPKGPEEVARATAFDVAIRETVIWGGALLANTVLAACYDGVVPVPDLRPLGIRQCVGCGCTDN